MLSRIARLIGIGKSRYTRPTASAAHDADAGPIGFLGRD